MSKKHPVKSTQSSARTTAAPASRPDDNDRHRDHRRPDDNDRHQDHKRPDDGYATSNAQASAAGATGDVGRPGVPGTNPEASAEIRAQMIAEAAYYLSEQRGFAPGHEVEDWLAAEQQIDTRIEDGRGVTGPMQIS